MASEIPATTRVTAALVDRALPWDTLRIETALSVPALEAAVKCLRDGGLIEPTLPTGQWQLTRAGRMRIEQAEVPTPAQKVPDLVELPGRSPGKTQRELLQILAGVERAPIKELARQTRICSSALGDSLAGLLRRGLVDYDRKGKAWGLTEMGRKVVGRG